MVRCLLLPRVVVLGATLALPLLALAQTGAEGGGTRLPPVVVTATRTEAAPFDVPASIDRIGGDGIRDARLQVNISESLGGVPGLLARDRQNYAQDVQISVRGFGARSTFGIRGVRLYVDGIPATLPDGQGQISNVDLGSAERIEVLRGPFSALYGNSSGGVIQVFTEEGSGPPTLTTSVAGGSDGALRLGAKASGSSGAFGYVASVSHFQTDGYRDHSAAERNLGNVKLTWKPDDASKLTLVANSVALPKAQDPLGLTRAQFDADPRGVDPVGDDLRHPQDRRPDPVRRDLRTPPRRRQCVRALVYTGHRNTEQFQAIPVAPQNSPLHPGGVIALGRDYSGTDLRWTAKTLAEARRSRSSPASPTTRSTSTGSATRTSSARRSACRARCAATRTTTSPTSTSTCRPRGSSPSAGRVNAGVRHSSVRFASADHYVVGTNPDDSGSVRYGATLPVIGLMFAASDSVHLYATAGRGFETPTLNELAYRPNGATGLNLALQAAHSDSYEAGVKTRNDRWGDFNVALFETRTQDEIVTLSNVGGRSTFQNAGATRRRGLEAAWNRDRRATCARRPPTPGSTRATATPSRPAPRRRAPRPT